MVVLKGKDSGDPTVPAQGIGLTRQVYSTGVRRAWYLFDGREILCCTKVKLFKEHTRDKVRRWFTLLVTARVGGTTGQAPMYWWSWLLSLSATHPKGGNDNGCLDRK